MSATVTKTVRTSRARHATPSLSCGAVKHGTGSRVSGIRTKTVRTQAEIWARRAMNANGFGGA